jgi:hypothetical protein
MLEDVDKGDQNWYDIWYHSFVNKISYFEKNINFCGHPISSSSSKAALKGETAAAAVITPSIMRPAAAPSPAGSLASLPGKVSYHGYIEEYRMLGF